MHQEGHIDAGYMFNRFASFLKTKFLRSVKEIHLPDSAADNKSLRLVLLSDLYSPDNFYMNELTPQEFDLVLTLGDINEPTLDYILNQGRHVGVYGVYGNHDPQYIPGMRALDNKIIVLNGYKISGISGVNTHYQCVHAYSEKAIVRKLKRLGTVDILIAHVPPYSLSKDEDPIHQGFKALDDYILQYSPKYVFYGLHRRQKDRIGQTEVVGVYGKEFVRI